MTQYLTDYFVILQGWLFDTLVQPVLFALGLASYVEMGFDGIEFVLQGAGAGLSRIGGRFSGFLLGDQLGHAGFGAGTYADDVASFIAQEMARRMHRK